MSLPAFLALVKPVMTRHADRFSDDDAKRCFADLVEMIAGKCQITAETAHALLNGSDGKETLNRDDLSRKTCDELKALCKERKLPVGGKKSEPELANLEPRTGAATCAAACRAGGLEDRQGRAWV